MYYVYAGFLPLVVTNDVSPPGNHSVRIVAGTGPEDTVLFFINSHAQTTGELHIKYDNYNIIICCDHLTKLTVILLTFLIIILKM